MNKKIIVIFLLIISLILTVSNNVLVAQELASSSISIGNNSSNTSTPTRSIGSENASKEPKITNYIVNGDVDNTKNGIDFYKNISITLIGENLTDRNFLTKEGLHWSDKTYVELINGKELGIFQGTKIFGPQNTPATEVKAYRNNNGDSGRINFVGKTKSNEDLDLVWTVIDSDKDDWVANSGYNNLPSIKGLGFAGEQYIPGAKGNSIVVLYNNASNLAINYKIVKHGTMEEMPVVLSFISTDIDGAQGVDTNLANITEIIPKESGLAKENNIIYDTTKGSVGLNGSVDLPKGGYLGAGFLSNFDYVFYSPAPARVNDSYDYPISVRYDIFGSSLQANLYTRLKNRITVSFVDELGDEIKPSENFEGFHDEKYFFESVIIPKYKQIDIRKDETDLNHPKIQFVYRPIYSVSLKFLDEKGNKLSEDKTFLVEKGYILSYNAPTIDSYSTPNVFNTEVNGDVQYEFVYKKIAKLDDKKEDSNPKNNSQSTKPIVKEPIKENTKPSIRRINNSLRPNVNVNSYPIGISKNKVPISHSSNKETVSNISNVRDPFLENTGMSKEEKEAFLKYIRSVAKDSKERNGNDINKINHDVSNAIIYDVYYNDKKQKITNDFGQKPKALDDYMIKLLRRLHDKDNYIVDFPHLAAPLSTSEKSVWWKQVVKAIIGFNSQGVPTEDTFFQLNSMVGDRLSNLDDKDKKSNMDAYILKHHPKFKDLQLDERIERYYHIENLNDKRKIFYDETLEIKAKEYNKSKTDYEKWLIAGSLGTLGAAYLIGKRQLKKQFNRIKGEIKEFVNSPGKYIKNKIIKPIKNVIVKTATTTVSLLKTTAKKIVTGIKQVGRVVNNTVVKPATKFIKNTIVKPTIKFVKNTIIKPIKKVSSYAYKKVLKPVGSFINRNIIKPIGNFFGNLFKRK